MESRKYQLQKQIIEAIKANDHDLSSLLKSQWAHRFGVESLEELNKLDVTFSNQNTINEDKQHIDQSQDYALEVNKEISIKDDDDKEKEISSDTKEIIDSVEIHNKESFAIKSSETVEKEDYDNKDINPVRGYKTPPKVEALIPLPPKPKYSYLRKWLLRS